MRVAVLGGYGNFGERICRALAGNDGIELVVGGRNLRKAQLLAGELEAVALVLDADAPDLAAQLRAAGVGLLIHTAGPFQAQDYRVARAAAAAGAHYIDLADGRRFVCDFAGGLDDAFHAAGLCAVTGASTVPALSSAVVDEYVRRFGRLDSVSICIAPAQTAPRGLATLAGVLSYCGMPVRVWQDGRWQDRYGWADPGEVRFARLEPRLGALCDIPDLELFPGRYAGVQDVMFRAALEVRLTQRVFAALSWLRRRGLLAGTQPVARLLHRFGSLFDPFGTPDGAMVVHLRGLAPGGQPLQWGWHLTAGRNHGPEIPCMPAILLARRIAAGEGPPTGAHTSTGLLRLADFEPEFARWGMVTDAVQEAGP
jgi:saccharopine dehydrogenase-like NADP-dependent oxidoreductase